MNIQQMFHAALQHDTHLVELFGQQLSGCEQSLYFVDRQGLRTERYADFYTKVQCQAAQLQARGLKKGQGVILVCDDEFQLMLGFWAIMVAGGVSIPLSAPMSFDDNDTALLKIVAVLQQCDGACLLTDLDTPSIERLAERADGLTKEQIFSFDKVEADRDAFVVDIHADDVAMVMYSSGSTGDPKGVCLTHRNLINNLAQIAERSELTSEDRSLSWLPLTHDMGLILFHLCHTMAAIDQFKVTAFSFVREPLQFLQLISDQGITITGMPNFGFDTLLRAWDHSNNSGLSLASLRIIYNGAEPINPKLMRKFYQTFAEVDLPAGVISSGYGIAECCVVASLFPQSELIKRRQLPTLLLESSTEFRVGQRIVPAKSDSAMPLELVSLGPLMPDMQVRVLGDEGQLLEPGQLGHIEFSGPNVSPGYWQREPQSWCQTGDLGFMYEGEMFITGRHKDVLFINGKNHYSNDLERVLCEAVGWAANQLAVIGFRDQQGEVEEIALFVRKDRDLDKANYAHMKRELERLIAYPVSKVVGLSVLPKTTSGKIRRFELRDGLMNGQYQSDLIEFDEVEAGDSDECSIWLWSQVCELIKRDYPIPASSQSLAQYGFDSVRWLQLTHRLNKALSLQLTQSSLIDAQTFGGLRGLLPDSLPEVSSVVSLADQSKVALSDNQYAIWTSYLLDESSTRYNESYSMHLTANLQLDRFCDAVERVVLHHPMLHACVDDQTQPQLVYNTPTSWTLTVVDHTDVAESMSVAELNHLFEKKSAEPFDLRAGAPFRIELHRLSDNHYGLFMSAHHLVIDGWSFNLLIQQLFDSYQDVSLPLAQAERLWGANDSQPNDADQQHWQDVLESSDAIELPKKVATQSSGSVAMLNWVATDQLKNKLQNIAARHDLTLYPLLATALSILFSRLSDKPKVRIGTMTANRHCEDDMRRIGYFAQTQPYALSITSDANFIECARELATQVQYFSTRSTVSLDRISELVGMDVTSSLEVVYVHQNSPAIQTPEQVQILSRDAYRQEARTGLYLTSEMIDHELVFNVEYDTSKYEPDQVQYYLDLFKHLLNQLTTRPQRSLEKLNWMTESHQLRVENLCRTDDYIDLEKNFIQHFYDTVQAYGKLVAVSDDQVQFSYEQLKQRADTLSLQLVEAGIEKGDRICLMTDRSVAYVVALIATLQAGAVFVPLDPALPADRTDYIINDCAAKLILTNAETDILEKYSGHHQVCSFSVFEDVTALAFNGPQILGSDGAYLIYTSGTTGRPKGVYNDHKSLANLVAWLPADFHYQPGEVMCQFAPFSFDVSLGEVLPALSFGLHLYILPPEKRASAECYLEVLKEKAVNVATVTPAFFYQFKDSPEVLANSMADMRLFILGGEALSTAEIQVFQSLLPHVQVVNVYGPTETTVLSSFYFIPNPVPDSEQWQPLGAPIANTNLMVLTPSHQPALLMQPGEIYISGAGVSQGYWQDEEKTNTAFQSLTVMGKTERYYKTGDLARITLDGQLEFIGRADNQIKIRGFRVELGEVEKALEAIDQVDQAVVLAKTMPSGSKALVAYYCGEVRSKADFNTRLEQTLPHYMLPEFYINMAKMPLTPNRKVNRKALPEVDVEAQLEAGYQAPEGDVEKTLAELWCQMLSLSKVGREDNFVDLGGNSLLVAKLLYLVKSRFSLDMSVAQLFSATSLKDMALVIEQKLSKQALNAHQQVASEPPSLVAQMQTTYPLSETQLAMVFAQLNSEDASVNCIPYTLSLATPIEPRKIYDALVLLAERHPVLNAIFEISEQGVQQHFHAQSVDFSDTQCLDEAALYDLARAFHQKGYDLQQGPLWRVMVCQANNGPQWINFNFHHAIADGVSLGLFVNDLDVLLQGGSLPTHATAPNYGDYCHWLTQLDDARLAPHQEYWQRTLSQIQPIALPLNNPSDRSTVGTQKMYGLDAALSTAFVGYCNEHTLSPFNTFLTFVSVLLQQRTKQNEFALGLTFAGRENAEQDVIFGLFVNTLPLMVNLDQDKTIAEQAKNIQHDSFELMAHQTYPLASVQRLSGRREELFNVLFNQEVVEEVRLLNNQPAKLVGINTETARFPLTFSLLLGQETVQWRIEYQQAQFSEEWVSQFHDELVALIQRTIDMPSLPISTISDVNDELMALLDLD